jgi:beta-N-acetylhexosaminidase
MDHFQMNKNSSSTQLADMASTLSEYNLVIVGMHRGQWFPWSTETYGTQVYDWLGELAADKKLVVASFRSPYLIPDFPVGAWNSFVTTYQDGHLYQDYAAQLIFGGISSQGQLPVTVSKKWQSGFGLTTEGEIRFKYTVAEEVGVDSRELERRVDSVVHAGLDAKAYPGAQVMLSKDKKVFYRKAYGYHTYDQKRPVLIDDIYDLASLTKVTGATAGLMKLHDHNKFDLEASMKDYFPSMSFSNKKNVDFRNILAHNAKMKAWIAYHTTTSKANGKYRRKTLSKAYSDDFPYQLAPELYMHKDYKEKIYKMIKKAPMNDNEGYLYSGLAFYLFPDLISRTSGVPYPEYLDQTFYAPLGANTLMYNPLDKYPLEQIVPTEKDDYFRNMQLHGVVHDEGAAMMRGVSGNAGLFSNANDLAKMWQMYMDFGSYGGERYLSYQTIQKFTACQFCEEGNKRGLGFDKPDLKYDALGSSMAKDASPQTFGHSGYTGTLVWADPVENFMFVFLSNRVYPTRDNRLLYTMNIRPTIHNIVYDLLPD